MIRVRLSLMYPALEAGVRALLAADPLITVVHEDSDEQSTDETEAADVQIVTSAALSHQFDLDRGRRPNGGVIFLGAEKLDTAQLWLLDFPWGVLPIEVASEELCAAVRAVAAGLIVGPRPLLRGAEEQGAVRGPLTEREVEILAMLSRGLANKQVAAELGISEHTVKFHVSSIYTKLNVANRTEAVREGLRNGWITL